MKGFRIICIAVGILLVAGACHVGSAGGGRASSSQDPAKDVSIKPGSCLMRSVTSTFTDSPEPELDATVVVYNHSKTFQDYSYELDWLAGDGTEPALWPGSERHVAPGQYITDPIAQTLGSFTRDPTPPITCQLSHVERIPNSYDSPSG
jgi:hypothetical protein